MVTKIRTINNGFLIAAHIKNYLGIAMNESFINQF